MSYREGMRPGYRIMWVAQTVTNSLAMLLTFSTNHCFADNLDEWTLQSLKPYLTGISSSQNAVVAVESGGDITRSTNGADWVVANSAQNPFAGDVTVSFRDLAFGNGVFVAVGVHYSGPRLDLLVTSQDGINWFEQPKPPAPPR